MSGGGINSSATNNMGEVLGHNANFARVDDSINAYRMDTLQESKEETVGSPEMDSF